MSKTKTTYDLRLRMFVKNFEHGEILGQFTKIVKITFYPKSKNPGLDLIKSQKHYDKRPQFI